MFPQSSNYHSIQNFDSSHIYSGKQEGSLRLIVLYHIIILYTPSSLVMKYNYMAMIWLYVYIIKMNEK